MKYHAKKIGLFISHIFGRYQSELCQGVIDCASEYGYRVEIYPSTDGENVGGYGLGEESILKIPDYRHLSAVIFASGTYLSPELRRKITVQLKETCTCPILEICNEHSVFPRLLLNNSSMFGMLTEHFLTVHKKKRICYLGNSDHEELSLLRRNFYRNALEKHGRAVSEADTLSCPENDESIRRTLETFLTNRPERPDAILCYNDGMALTLLRCLLRAGIRVPEDISIAGCDDLPFGRESTPQLTTISFPIKELGRKAVELIRAALSGEILPPETEFQAQPIYRTSCGCPVKEEIPPFLLPARLSSKIDTLETTLISDIRMSAELHRITELDTGMDLLEDYVRRINGISEFYLCLYPDWDSVPGQIQKFTMQETEEYEENPAETMLLKFAFQKGRRLPECSFVHQSALPEYLYTRSDAHYLYQPLYFGDKSFGYIAMSYEENKLQYPFSFISWLRNVNSMLENICRTRHMGLLVEKLDDLYNHDELTGLYNRRSFLTHAEAALEENILRGQNVLAMRIDIDSLHLINEQFGHDEGNFAIRVVGHAIENAASPQDICGRTGGDSFYIFASGSEEKEAISLQERIDKYLEHYNKLHTKPYLISVTTGFTLTAASHVRSLTELFHASDRQLHEEKQRKSRSVLKLQDL